MNSELNVINAHVEEREKYKPNTWFVYLKILIIIAFIITSLFLAYGFIWRIDNMKVHKSQIQTEYLQTIKKNQNKEAAEMLYHSAELHFSAGNLNYAQSEIVRVLSLFPNNIEAIQLMHKILDAQCKTKSIYSKQAKEYQEYLNIKLN